MDRNEATFRFYAWLNDLLSPRRKSAEVAVAFDGAPAVKDTIESLGIPHTEVSLILVNGTPRGPDYHLCDGDRVSVYPPFATFNTSVVTGTPELTPHPPRFICDVHLGKTARRLRLLGFDTLYRNDYSDPEIVRIALAQDRIVLTRDRGLLKYAGVRYGCLLRSTSTDMQVNEIALRYDLYSSARPFTRCTRCNGRIEPVSKKDVERLLEPKTRECYDTFRRCTGCKRVYWEGSHVERVRNTLRLMGISPP
jgi:uncharacterized protein with PIN domain